MQAARGEASIIRADVMMAIARGLARDRSDPSRPYRDLRVSLGAVQDGIFHPALSFSTGTPDLAFAVARGDIDVAVVNPAAFLTMAYRGTGPFAAPLPLRAIAVMPSWDRMAFAVRAASGIDTLEDLAHHEGSLHISLRRNTAHATRFVIDEALTALGLTLADLQARGAVLHYVDTPSHDDRLRGIIDGTLDAVFDEGIKGWGPVALTNGMRFPSLGATVQAHFSRLGWAVAPIPAGRIPGLTATVAAAASFSGWPVFARADLPEQTAYQMVAALDAARHHLTWDTDDLVNLQDLRGGTDAAPCEVPLHPGAERYFREHSAQ